MAGRQDGEGGGRREHARVPVNHEFRSLDEFIREYVADISRGGVFVRTAEPLPVGTRVDLRFTVIADELETVEGLGTVVRAVAPGGAEAAGMGIAFDDLTPQSQAVVNRLTRDIPRR
ncbi:MAG: TIGR02266 family protein [Deltaproteobacteria bacterium]|nr:TIGR02266 family protein [Deltaproteobacteria bacterium]